ncbi:MAG TPA: transglycosylase domain-containing protein [Solirubrobacterales bacterium]|nr:transglycosylase domain-containing protein [Solirubrobacterales bacterium]
MPALRQKPRRPGGTVPPPPPPASQSKRAKPRLKKLRVLFVLMGLAVLAVFSMVFGMVVAVSQQLPDIYNFARYTASKNSEVFDATGEPIGTLTSNQNKILLESDQISPNMKNAVISIEDSRFYQHEGVDFQGIGRALVKDIMSRSAAQGASTITEQFVKDALAAQDSRTLFQKFREAVLAYRLEQRWSKDEILTQYLNTIYFGEGAYGIEAAARTFFGEAHPDCGTETEPCAAVLEPWEAALLAGVIASPSAYDPKFFPENALARRNLVLERMYEQGYITAEQLEEGTKHALPAPDDIAPPTLDSEAPYFTSWLRQQLVDRYGAAKTFFGGLKVKTTLDLDLQHAAEEAVTSYLGELGPTASLVVIDNRNAGIKAMVGGPDFEQAPFNLATLGHRQPGSSIKPIILATALQQGISPETVYASEPKVFSFGKKDEELFEVKNYGDSYLGSASLATATTYSDNSVYAQVGLESIAGGPRAIARTAHRLGAQTHLSTNPAMVLGGLKEGVTPLEWTYVFSTIANDGTRVSGTLAPDPGRTPVAFTQVTDQDGDTIKGGDNDSIDKQVLPEDVAQETKSILGTVITSGTGVRADIGDESQWGKTGTTDDNGDAWFCGATDEVTACVWVGYADTLTPMLTEFSGGPVDGGTFPALIWASVISAWEEIQAENAAAKESEDGESSESGEGDSYTPPEENIESTPEPEGLESEPQAEPEPELPPEEAAPEEAAPEESAPESGGGLGAPG